MCLMLYLGTATPLPIVSSADLRVESVEGTRSHVRQWFTQPAVHFIGAHTGCSCGFPSVMAESPVTYYQGMPLDSDNRAADLRSVAALLNLLRRALGEDAIVQLYPIADGDETVPPKGHIEWTLAALDAERLFFNEGFMHHVRDDIGAVEPRA
jgi:hypothetical protein